MINSTLFGTDGIRARIGELCFTDDGIIHLGHALAQWITHMYQRPAHIVIGHDTRQSGAWIQEQLTALLLQYDHTISYASIITTPLLNILVQQETALDLGLMITASHNPWYYNGLKICTKEGKIGSLHERFITQLWHNKITSNSLLNTYAHGKKILFSEAVSIYHTLVQLLFAPTFLKGLTIVLDCAHGSASNLAPMIFQAFGATVISIADQPNGTNINEACGALHPASLQKAVIDHKAHVGFAFDGDGDRVIAVAADGMLRDGDDILALLSHHPRYKEQNTVVATVMSNYGFERWLQEQGKKLLRTPVGDTHVGHALKEHNLLLGGEQSGHIIMKDFLHTGDGIFTALRILETLLLTDNIPWQTFVKYPQVLLNIPIDNKSIFTPDTLEKITSSHTKDLTNGRILVRMSGTEPLIRVMVEDIDHKQAYTVAHTIESTCKTLIASTQ